MSDETPERKDKKTTNRLENHSITEITNAERVEHKIPHSSTNAKG